MISLLSSTTNTEYLSHTLESPGRNADIIHKQHNESSRKINKTIHVKPKRNVHGRRKPTCRQGVDGKDI